MPKHVVPDDGSAHGETIRLRFSGQLANETIGEHYERLFAQDRLRTALWESQKFFETVRARDTSMFLRQITELALEHPQSAVLEVLAERGSGRIRGVSPYAWMDFYNPDHPMVSAFERVLYTAVTEPLEHDVVALCEELGLPPATASIILEIYVIHSVSSSWTQRFSCVPRPGISMSLDEDLYFPATVHLPAGERDDLELYEEINREINRIREALLRVLPSRGVWPDKRLQLIERNVRWLVRSRVEGRSINSLAQEYANARKEDGEPPDSNNTVRPGIQAALKLLGQGKE